MDLKSADVVEVTRTCKVCKTDFQDWELKEVPLPPSTHYYCGNRCMQMEWVPTEDLKKFAVEDV